MKFIVNLSQNLFTNAKRKFSYSITFEDLSDKTHEGDCRRNCIKKRF